jgi:hypothetical protein
VIDRFAGLHFDDALYAAPAPLSREHDVRELGRCTGTNRSVLLRAGVDGRVEAAPKLGLEQSDDTVVFELLPDRPNQNGAHERPPKNWMLTLRTAKSNTVDPKLDGKE